MGTEMALFVELITDDADELVTEFWGLRSYELFDALGDGRSAGDPGQRLTEARPLVEPRGLPERLSLAVLGRLFLADLDPNSVMGNLWPGKLGIGEAGAETRVVSSAAFWRNRPEVAIELALRPGYRTTGWLTPTEALQSVAANNLEPADFADPLVSPMLQYLAAIQQAPVRLVFAFSD